MGKKTKGKQKQEENPPPSDQPQPLPPEPANFAPIENDHHHTEHQAPTWASSGGAGWGTNVESTGGAWGAETQEPDDNWEHSESLLHPPPPQSHSILPTIHEQPSQHFTQNRTALSDVGETEEEYSDSYSPQGQSWDVTQSQTVTATGAPSVMGSPARPPDISIAEAAILVAQKDLQKQHKMSSASEAARKLEESRAQLHGYSTRAQSTAVSPAVHFEPLNPHSHGHQTAADHKPISMASAAAAAFESSMSRSKNPNPTTNAHLSYPPPPGKTHWTSPKPLVPGLHPPATIPVDASWIMTGGNAWSNKHRTTQTTSAAAPNWSQANENRWNQPVHHQYQQPNQPHHEHPTQQRPRHAKHHSHPVHPPQHPPHPGHATQHHRQSASAQQNHSWQGWGKEGWDQGGDVDSESDEETVNGWGGGGQYGGDAWQPASAWGQPPANPNKSKDKREVGRGHGRKAEEEWEQTDAWGQGGQAWGQSAQGGHDEQAWGQSAPGGQGEQGWGKSAPGGQGEQGWGKSAPGGHGGQARGQSAQGGQGEQAWGKSAPGGQGGQAWGQGAQGGHGGHARGQSAQGGQGGQAWGQGAQGGQGEQAWGQSAPGGQGGQAWGQSAHGGQGEQAWGQSAQGGQDEQAWGQSAPGGQGAAWGQSPSGGQSGQAWGQSAQGGQSQDRSNNGWNQANDEWGQQGHQDSAWGQGEDEEDPRGNAVEGAWGAAGGEWGAGAAPSNSEWGAKPHQSKVKFDSADATGSRNVLSPQQRSQILNSLLNQPEHQKPQNGHAPQQTSAALAAAVVASAKKGQHKTHDRHDTWETRDRDNGWGSMDEDDEDDNRRVRFSPKASEIWGGSPRSVPSKPLANSHQGVATTLINDASNARFVESRGAGFAFVSEAFFGNARFARERIHWLFPADKDARVANMLAWVQKMSFNLGTYGLMKFLEKKERGALFVNTVFRMHQHPQEPAFDYLTFNQLQGTMDKTLQESVAFYDPARLVIIFVYLPSESGNSVAIWRVKVNVPDNARLKYQDNVNTIVRGLRKDKEYIVMVDELPPKPKPLPQKPGQLRKSVSAKATGKRTAQPIEERKRKWWKLFLS